MRTLHELPPFRDRWSYLYLEHGELDQQAAGLVFHNATSLTPLPINQMSLLMLGPGTSVTHAAVKALAGNNCLLAWVGEQGVRLYAHSTGGTFSARRLLAQARLVSDPDQRLAVAKRMYSKRFPGENLDSKTMEQIRGMEGARVRTVYAQLAAKHGATWAGRNYDQDHWTAADPVNRALSCANACLYGVCHAGIVSAGYSAGLGFIHTGKLLSFVYDIADLYKTEVTVPIAFRIAAATAEGIERKVRLECRQAFHDTRLVERILPDIAEVLGHAGDDLGEGVGELEGRAVSMADPADAGGVLREPEPTGPGSAVDEGVPEDQDWERDSDLDEPQ
ncbi:MAG: type I-E CRISPR-associated endonuclease Cas1 [Planctomycetes bacterium]|nr:type I-E CRISPR-associated endonuclease Cas1 [Planctomycetota bacterium]